MRARRLEGRRRRDTSVINEAVELRRSRCNVTTNFFDWRDSEGWHDFSMTTEQVYAVLQHEDGSVSVPEPLVEFGAPSKLGADRVPAK